MKMFRKGIRALLCGVIISSTSAVSLATAHAAPLKPADFNGTYQSGQMRNEYQRNCGWPANLGAGQMTLRHMGNGLFKIKLFFPQYNWGHELIGRQVSDEVVRGQDQWFGIIANARGGNRIIRGSISGSPHAGCQLKYQDWFYRR